MLQGKKLYFSVALGFILLVAGYFYATHFLHQAEVRKATAVLKQSFSVKLKGRHVTEPKEASAFAINKVGVFPLVRMKILETADKYYQADEEKEVQALIENGEILLFEFYVLDSDHPANFGLLAKKNGNWEVICFSPEVFNGLAKEKPKKKPQAKKPSPSTTIVTEQQEPSKRDIPPSTTTTTLVPTTTTLPSSTTSTTSKDGENVGIFD